jgi:hypothetical protein
MNDINPALFAITTKFPDLREEFIHLFKHSEAFRGVCMDYRECVKAHKYWSRSTDRDAVGRKREYEELLSELEEELLQSIKKKR